MKVADHNKFRLFDYENDLTNPNFELGDVLIKINEDGSIEDQNGNPIGVVIQLHPDGDCRTDMYGNVCVNVDVRLATIEEITKFRSELLNDLIPMKTYSIPITWQSYKRYEVQAENLEDAVKKGLELFLAEPDNTYSDDSFGIDEIINEENEGETFDYTKIINNL